MEFPRGSSAKVALNRYLVIWCVDSRSDGGRSSPGNTGRPATSIAAVAMAAAQELAGGTFSCDSEHQRTKRRHQAEEELTASTSTHSVRSEREQGEPAVVVVFGEIQSALQQRLGLGLDE